MKIDFWLAFFLVFAVILLLSAEDPDSSSTRSRKKKRVVFVLTIVSIIGLALSAGMIAFTSESAKGKVKTELATDVTYATEWFNADGSVAVMKLRADGSKQALYYEIPKDKIIFWGKEDKKVPPKFRVLTDKEGKVYALKEVD